MRDRWQHLAVVVATAALTLAGCGDVAKSRRILQTVGAGNLRAQTLAVCREGFSSGASRKIEPEQWPDAVRTFRPLGLWAEPDGAYLLLDTDADGEHGIYLPRFLSDQDPLCSPALKHEKLGTGVYWYDRKR